MNSGSFDSLNNRIKKSPKTTKIIKCEIELSSFRGEHPQEYEVYWIYSDGSKLQEWKTIREIYDETMKKNIPISSDFRKFHLEHMKKELIYRYEKEKQ